MLSRRDQPSSSSIVAKKRNKDEKSPLTSSSKATASATTSITNRPATSRGEKRKSTDVDPHDKEGSEYLRRKHNFIKSTILVDYQPDICKDYKETGFCGFGDSCKFLHDRSDYKHGWQLEQEYAKGQYKDDDDEKYLIKDSDEEQDEVDESKCKICQETYKDPIVTKCHHYFCDACAEKRCIEKCFICEKPTSGIFKPAKIDHLLMKTTRRSLVE